MSFASLHLDTPLVQTAPGYSASGKPLWLKLDALQPSGSFKLRGVGRLCRHEVENGAREIFCASGGNAGIAAAYAGRGLGVPVTIVVPETTAADVRQTIAATGANVLVHGSVFDEANAHAVELARSRNATYVHPFDHPLLWDGHATLIDEVVAKGAKFDCVVTSVGGGGLLAGIVEGLKRNGLSDVPVIAVETEGAASLNASLEANERIVLPAITSIANSLGARQVAQHVFDLPEQHPIESVVVSDADAVAACLKFADAYRILVEPACGAALAVADVHAGLLQRFDNPLIEVCGGIGVSLEKLKAWKEKLL
ncbi:pyridoxal-phosphate dependent enzyme [Rhizobium binxianense]|uniref:pyridoxal-phosphate dependent enzyme n=1 Tax=Rhizobium binxianense TaxID=3024242 RepID=UPI00235FCDDD|nr:MULTISPECIES: pyridoxal-phosphate dependent enzyme [unclassified Rhizobium]MDC9810478.1 pyridoxal-phosphate dependent enzyme [Rhizobium sp. MC62]WEA25385.1 pyridoxal-phosphate dependent enzyme [Rhizobium sp. MJ22]WEA59914.1 pyridoxal-phosphate dependent enzyme [Rhizobium sp. BJ04]